MDKSYIDIISEIKSGNQEAFEQIFKKYYSLLCFEARGYIKSDNLIEEIVCDVFTRIWIHRENLVIKTSLRDYLVKAVHNNCIDYYRQLKRQESLTVNSENKEQTLYSLISLDEDPLEYILTNELEDKILNIIESLPPQYKKAFKLSRFENMSYEEIATKMQISVNSVKTDIKNALAIIRKELNNFFVIAFAFFIRYFF